MKVFTNEDADRAVLEGKTVAIAGYGNQGRPQALNLRQSGFHVLVGARAGGAGWDRAKSDGFEVVSIDEAARRANVLLMLLPDEVQGAVFASTVRPALADGAAICFAHGFSVAFGEISSETHDLVLVAPKGQGERLREAYLEGTGLPCLIGVEKDVSGRATAIALALAWGLGCLRVGGYETSFREEAVSDLFGEQAVLCGAVPAIVKQAFDLLVRHGYSPEVAYFECVDELKIIVDLFTRLGLAGMREVISGTAAYGSLKYGEALIGAAVAEGMKELFDRIEGGAFAKAWLAEHAAGGSELSRLRDKERALLVEKVGREIRGRAGGPSRHTRAGAEKG
jgi:ketol-acid reductoisomerase